MAKGGSSKGVEATRSIRNRVHQPSLHTDDPERRCVFSIVSSRD